MRKALVVGGANGIGLSIAVEFASRDDFDTVYIVDRVPPSEEVMHPKFVCSQFDLTSEDYSIFDRYADIDTLMITAGFGRLALFKDLSEDYIINSMNVNSTAVMRIIHRFYNKLESSQDFYCGVMVSIAGFMSSPFFSVYGASKAALKIFIESVNVELEKAGSSNRILNVSPGSIKGTSFNQAKTDLSQTSGLAGEIISHLEAKDDLFIPQYEEIFKKVLERYNADFREEGRHSYEYKLNSGRIK
jgi:short-subunit dehydrogenase